MEEVWVVSKNLKINLSRMPSWNYFSQEETSNEFMENGINPSVSELAGLDLGGSIYLGQRTFYSRRHIY